jgi:hypothetical protein
VLDYWVCLKCRSVNRPNASKCYSCRAPKGTPLETAEEPKPVVEAAPKPVVRAARKPAAPAAAKAVAPANPEPVVAAALEPVVERASEPVAGATPELVAEAAPPVVDAGAKPPRRRRPRAAPAAVVAPDVVAPGVPEAVPPGPTKWQAHPIATLAGETTFEAAGPPQTITELVAAESALHYRVVRRRRMGRGLVAVGIAAVLVAGGFLLVTRRVDTPPARQALTGRLDLVQSRGSRAPNYVTLREGQDDCTGAGKYANVRIGMPITVEGNTGLLVGQGWLGAGQVTEDAEGSSPACSFTFTVSDLAGAPIYRVSAGDLDSVEVSAEDLQAAGWEVLLKVGP